MITNSSILTVENKFLKPNPWVAWKTYTTNEEARSIIANEKRHEKIFLEDVSALLWHEIENGISIDDLKLKASKYDAQNEVDDFLLELEDLELITLSNKNSSLKIHGNQVPEPKDMEYAENSEPELEFQRWVMSHGFMYSTHWELTYRCNERCVHCYNPGAAHLPNENVARNTNELSTEQVFNTLEKIAAGGVFILTLSGGEIMLRKDFYEIVAFARKLGMAVNIYTNGLRLDEESLAKLASLWPSSVGISIYSNDPEAHDFITKVPGSYEKSVNALMKLNGLGIRTSLKSVQFNHTIPAFFGIKDLAKKVGAIPETELGLSPGTDGAIAPMLMSASDPRELIIAAMTPGFPIYVGDKSTNYGEFIKDKKATVCAAGLAGLSFGADGNVYPCNSLPIKSGNLHHDDPLELWNAALSQRKSINTNQIKHVEKEVINTSLLNKTSNLAKWQDIRLQDYEECGTHRRCNWCVKCPGMAMMETGRPLAPSTTNCRIATARMFGAILLSNGISKDTVAAKLSISQNFGGDTTREFKSVNEPRNRELIALQPRNIKDLFSKKTLDRNVTNKPSYTTPHGEVWLVNGSKWNVEALRSFEPVRDIFEELKIPIK